MIPMRVPADLLIPLVPKVLENVEVLAETACPACGREFEQGLSRSDVALALVANPPRRLRTADGAAPLGTVAVHYTCTGRVDLLEALRVADHLNPTPVLVARDNMTLEADHPLCREECLTCGYALGVAPISLILVGFPAEDRRPGGWTAGGTVPIHSRCVGPHVQHAIPAAA